jgi:hypothetical protein
MLDAFWSGVGEELERHWVARVLSPAFAFWVGGLALLWWDSHAAAVAEHGWRSELAAFGDQIVQLPVIAQIVLIVGGLIAIAASAVVAERLTTPVLRLMEGYWTRPAWLRQWMVGYRRWRRKRIEQQAADLQVRQHRGTLDIPTYAELPKLRKSSSADPKRRAELERQAAQGLTAQERARLGRDLAWLLTSPETEALGMPTRLGDVLRAAEHRPAARYGLDGVVCWDALWLLLPEATRTELTQVRTALDGGVRGWLWGALFLVWTPVNAWAAVVGLLLPLLSYRFGVVPRAIAFGRLIVTCYDVHRMRLYDALHLPRPQSPAEERREAGQRVTALLAGTLTDQHLSYRFDPPEKPAG